MKKFRDSLSSNNRELLDILVITYCVNFLQDEKDVSFKSFILEYTKLLLSNNIALDKKLNTILELVFEEVLKYNILNIVSTSELGDRIRSTEFNVPKDDTELVRSASKLLASAKPTKTYNDILYSSVGNVINIKDEINSESDILKILSSREYIDMIYTE